MVKMQKMDQKIKTFKSATEYIVGWVIVLETLYTTSDFAPNGINSKRSFLSKFSVKLM